MKAIGFRRFEIWAELERHWYEKKEKGKLYMQPFLLAYVAIKLNYLSMTLFLSSFPPK